MDARSSDSLLAKPRSTNAVTALIHLHRAEVGLTTYRVRLDTTTSWAVTSSALVTTFALGNPQIPHVAFLFLASVILFFLQWNPDASVHTKQVATGCI
jgi:uncharacterized membrane protein